MMKTPVEALVSHLPSRLPRSTRVGIALSGGIDSCLVLAALLRKKVRPEVFTYTPSTHESTDYEYARGNAEALGLTFHPVRVRMDQPSLVTLARAVAHRGYRTKMQVESLSPMLKVVQAASRAGIQVLYTGDQADGFYINGNWISRNYDRSQGVPGRLRKHVKEDSDTTRIDKLREIYWQEDRANCAALSALAKECNVRAAMPYRNVALLEAFQGTHWREINAPRLKEASWQALGRLDAHRSIMVRPKPENLHRGDTRFAESMGAAVLLEYPQYKTPLGVYGAMARGDI